MRIRQAQPEEAGRIAEVHEAAARIAYAHIFPGQPFPRQETLERWRDFAGQLIVAEVDDVILGFVAFDPCELHALYVLPEHQHTGIGSCLLAAAGPVTRLWVLQENHTARSFYEMHGWRTDGAGQVSYDATELLYRCD